MVMVEATAVRLEGRISHGDGGLWNDAQTEGLASIAVFLEQPGAVPGTTPAEWRAAHSKQN